MKHTYAGHLQGQRPNGEISEIKPYLTQIERFYKRWGTNYLDNIRQTKPDSVTADNGRSNGGKPQGNFGLEGQTADSSLEEMFIGSNL